MSSRHECSNKHKHTWQSNGGADWSMSSECPEPEPVKCCVSDDEQLAISGLWE